MFYLNDRAVEAPAGTTLQELLELQGLAPALVAVTVNGKFVPRAEYRTLALPEEVRVRALELQDGG